jgi:hypothetical protein
MPRRPSKRIDLIPGALEDQLKLEIEIRSGQNRAYPLPTEVRGDIAKLLNVQIPDDVWQAINALTARYIHKERTYKEALAASAVNPSCIEIIKAMDDLLSNLRKLNPSIAELLELRGGPGFRDRMAVWLR